MPQSHALVTFRPVICAAALVFGLISPVLAMAAEAPAEQDRAGNRIEAFEATVATATDATAADSSAVHCTQDRQWCAQIRTDVQTGNQQLEVFDQTISAKARRTWRYPLPAGEGSDGSGGEPPSLWPRIVLAHSGDSSRRRVAMIGVVTHLRAGYSGGGAGADHLGLIKVDATPGGEAAFAEVLSVPLGGSATIRACFSEEDVKQRAEACTDEYNFSATLTLHDAKPAGLPQFDYVTEATSFPGPVSRSADSLDNPPLTEKDLVTVTNDECTYGRILRFDPVTGRYQFDTPVPDCSDYTVP